MCQYADGGIVGSKPYVSSANYINRMSDYCGGCRYDRKKRHGDDACPFNSLYWHFLERHRDRFSGNPRMAQMYRVFDRMDAEERRATLQQAETWLAQLEAL
jgi:deoxyribodipyrimidine photolyase-related protein